MEKIVTEKKHLEKALKIVRGSIQLLRLRAASVGDKNVVEQVGGKEWYFVKAFSTAIDWIFPTDKQKKNECLN